MTSSRRTPAAAPILAALAVAAAGCSALPGVGGGGPRQEADTITVMAYNIRHGEGTDGEIDLRRIADVIDAQEPDLVTLQEVDRRTDRVDGDDQARTALKVRVRSPQTDREIVIVGIHLYRTDEERLAQADRLIETLADETRPVILAGDFNSTPDDDVIDRFSGEWDILSKGRDRLTFPSTDPQREIDYVMVRPARQFYALEHRVLDEPLASDHRPLVAELIIRR